MRTIHLFLLLVLITAISSCRKYRMEHNGCKGGPFYEEGFFMPNLYTPNGDGNNDVLRFYHTLVPVSNFSLVIKNALGVKVYETHNPDFRWDGTNGKTLIRHDNYKYDMCFDAKGKHYHIKKTILVPWLGERNAGISGDLCVKNAKECGAGSQWDGTKYDPNINTNEFFLCFE